ncbi:hypothetical protein HPULCUR_009295 [Helicostylum pulchrum]|uniref:DNA repair metallo-beta-lactamase domain-containing protein n=1 Tax=Helicostylum pulchrum TaxID=562976 RepID=A0ABP9YB16_9FUNG
MTDLPYDSKPLEQMIIPFSTHSSLSEIVFFYNFVNPKEFTPCVARGGWETLDQMRLLLIQEGYRLNTDPSSSDIERTNASSSSCENTLTSTGADDDPQSSVEQSFNYISTCESVSGQVSLEQSCPVLFESKYCNELFITKTNTHKLIKSIKALQKRRVSL